MSTTSKLEAALTALLPEYSFVVDDTEDETLPPYCVKAFKSNVEVKHVHASEPVAANIASEVVK